MPADVLDRVQRIRLVKLFVDATLRGETPPRAASMLVASALQSYLSSTEPRADLARDYLQIRAPKGSHATAAALAARMQAANDDDGTR